jgi:hypothetical protein
MLPAPATIPLPVQASGPFPVQTSIDINLPMQVDVPLPPPVATHPTSKMLSGLASALVVVIPLDQEGRGALQMEAGTPGARHRHSGRKPPGWYDGKTTLFTLFSHRPTPSARLGRRVKTKTCRDRLTPSQEHLHDDIRSRSRLLLNAQRETRGAHPESCQAARKRCLGAQDLLRVPAALQANAHTRQIFARPSMTTTMTIRQQTVEGSEDVRSLSA